MRALIESIRQPLGPQEREPRLVMPGFFFGRNSIGTWSTLFQNQVSERFFVVFEKSLRRSGKE
jgi:hypothetical protein